MADHCTCWQWLWPRPGCFLHCGGPMPPPTSSMKAVRKAECCTTGLATLSPSLTDSFSRHPFALPWFWREMKVWVGEQFPVVSTCEPHHPVHTEPQTDHQCLPSGNDHYTTGKPRHYNNSSHFRGITEGYTCVVYVIPSIGWCVVSEGGGGCVVGTCDTADCCFPVHNRVSVHFLNRHTSIVSTLYL